MLGPEDIIPGNDIFGTTAESEQMLAEMEELAAKLGKPVLELTDEETASLMEKYNSMTEKVKILVSPDRYVDFKNDPNWARYVHLIEAMDYMPAKRSDIAKNGLNYHYLMNESGTFSTDQVVTQALSWWNVPIVAAEIAVVVATWGAASGAMAGGSTATGTAAGTAEGALTAGAVEASANSANTLFNQLAANGISSLSSHTGVTFAGAHTLLEGNISATATMTHMIKSGFLNTVGTSVQIPSVLPMMTTSGAASAVHMFNSFASAYPTRPLPAVRR